MRKSLLLPFAMVGLLAVGCNQKPAKADPFKFQDAISFYKANDINGIKLARYNAADKEARVEYDTTYVEDGQLVAKVYNTTRDEFDAYAESLVDLGWGLEKNSDEDYSGYYKDSAAILYFEDWLVVDYPDSTDDCVKLFFEIGTEVVTSCSFEEAVEFFATNGIEDVDIPDYEGEGFRVSSEFDDEGGAYLLQVSSAEEMATFVTDMSEAGWVLEENAYGDYSGVFGTTLAYVSIENWIGYSRNGIYIVFKLDAEHLTTFPAQEVIDWYADDDITVTMQNYAVAASNAYFTLVDDLEVQVFNSTHDEMDAFATLLSANGWTLETDSYGDYSGQYGETRAKIKIADYIDYGYGCIRIILSVGDRHYDAFPLTDANKFLTKYELGFSFTSETALPDAAGDGYTVTKMYDEGYHGFLIYTNGDQMAAYLAILDPILTAANYSLDDSSSDSRKVYCLNGDSSSHQVLIGFDNSTSRTYVALWE